MYLSRNIRVYLFKTFFPFLVSVSVLVSLAGCYTPGRHPGNEVKTIEKVSVWTCAMHPQIVQQKSGKYPICAMELIPR